ncbi:HupE/UreJ family protein [Candidatus Leptofilum sp.]|uniref:HupE/UreJ family protein n=1 Tax=Candidatus Leptofilum sp. TaxID=3241576 RepID=UPI003B5C90E9
MTLFGTIFMHTVGGGGIVSGFLHPILGLDHLLAMVAVGLLSAQLGGKAIWTVPATFVSIMAVGGILGLVGVPLPLVEIGIAGSVILLGIAIAANKGLPIGLAMSIVALFGLFHGHAHGTELPEITNTLGLTIAYVTGFLVATVGLHVIGALLGMMAIRNKRGTRTLQIAGGVISILGIFIITGIL